MSNIHRDLVATGTLISDAYEITSGATYAEFKTSEVGEQACQLPGASGGDIIQIKNNGTAPLLIFPQTGGSVNGAATNAADGTPLTTGQTVRYTTTDGTNWITMPDGVGQFGGLSKHICHYCEQHELVQKDSGAAFYVGPFGPSRVIILPAVKAGLNFRFILQVDGSGSITIRCSGSLALLRGGVISGTTVLALSGRNRVSFSVNKAITGDSIELECNGTYWFVRGWGTVSGAFSSSS